MEKSIPCAHKKPISTLRQFPMQRIAEFAAFQSQLNMAERKPALQPPEEFLLAPSERKETPLGRIWTAIVEELPAYPMWR